MLLICEYIDSLLIAIPATSRGHSNFGNIELIVKYIKYGEN